jgi:hypothetical protein
MTQDDATKIEDAAFVLLHVIVQAGFGSDYAKGSKKHFPEAVSAEVQGHVSLRTARELLEATDAWEDES